jgi:opacity protein-like surface antigen
MKRIASILTICGLAALPGLAQTSRFTGQIGGGFTNPLGSLGTRLDNGWNVTAGAGANANSHLGLMLDFNFNDFGITRTELNRLQVPGGNTRVWSFTLDPVVRLAPKESPVDVYLTGGGGIYHRTVEFTQPAIASVTVFNPWWGGFYPAAIGVNQVLGSFETYKPGFNVGAGVSVRLGSSNVKVFAEARYHHMFTNNFDTTFLPVSFGFRW